MAGNVWVLAEHWRGQVTEPTYELLALGRELADGLGTALEAVLLGHGMSDLAACLGAADTVVYVDHPALAEATSDVGADVLARLLEERQPHGLLLPLTNLSWDVVGPLPARLSAPFVNFCRDLRVADGDIEARCLLYGGKMEATVTAAGRPAILGVLPGARPAEAGRVDRAPSLEQVDVDIPDAPAVEFQRYIEPEAGDVDITQQEVLVSVGRGLQSEANLDLAEELAEILGGAVCGSRPAVDQGWLPLSRQVGKSGMQVRPKLYLALGISGAPEHLEGMKDSDLIIAVNLDPDAPIFGAAEYGIVEDLFDVVPPLIERARGTKGG